MIAGQDVGRLGHEMDPAEHHVLRLGLVGGDAGQPERVTTGIRPLHHLVPLVVMAQDEHPRAEGLLGCSDPFDELLGARRRVGVGKCLL